MKFKYFFAVLLAISLAPISGMAAIATATMNVQTTITAPTGTISVNGLVDFGNNRNDTTATIKVSTTLSIQVSNTTPYTIGMSAGNQPGTQAGVATVHRRMIRAGYTIEPFRQGPNTLPYSIFSNVLRTAKWGDGGTTINDPVVSRTGTGVTETVPVFASATVHASNTPTTPGSYSDTVTVTLTY